ncbi:MAG TPA: hypothetical protein VII38_01740, partial [Polyangia bacterium]
MNSSDALLEGGQETAISLATFLTILRKRKWMILGIVLAVPIVVGLVVSKEPKVYQATSSIVIDSTVPQYLGNDFKDAVDIETSYWSGLEILQTELHVLQSYAQRYAVAKALCDKKVGPEHANAFERLVPGGKCDDPASLVKGAAILETALTVQPIKESRVVDLVVELGDAEMTALVANTMAQVYIERNLERRLNQSAGASTWLGDEYGDMTTELNTAEQALIDFKKKNNVVSVGLEDQQSDLASRRRKLS